MYFEHDEMRRGEGEVQKDRGNDETHEKRRVERERKGRKKKKGLHAHKDHGVVLIDLSQR